MSPLPRVLAEVAPLYRALAAPRYEHVGNGVLIETRRAFAPHEVDEMELWVIAELLGVNDAATAADGGGLMTEAEFRAHAADLNRRRIEHARAVKAARDAGEPPPPPLPVPRSAVPEVTPAMMEALAARRRQREAQQEMTVGSEGRG